MLPRSVPASASEAVGESLSGQPRISLIELGAVRSSISKSQVEAGGCQSLSSNLSMTVVAELVDVADGVPGQSVYLGQANRFTLFVETNGERRERVWLDLDHALMVRADFLPRSRV